MELNNNGLVFSNDQVIKYCKSGDKKIINKATRMLRTSIRDMKSEIKISSNYNDEENANKIKKLKKFINSAKDQISILRHSILNESVALLLIEATELLNEDICDPKYEDKKGHLLYYEGNFIGSYDNEQEREELIRENEEKNKKENK